MPAHFDVVAATERFLDLLEGDDRPAVAEMLHPDVTWTAPMTTTGDPDDAESVAGRDAFLAHLATLSSMIDRAQFVERRTTVNTSRTTTFVQTRGDFRTRAGQPYRNTYVFRFDWRDNHILSLEEYANPITILNAFPELATS